MPIYDFKCRECGRVSEMFVRSLDSPVVRCPDCGSENMERLISTSFTVKTNSSTGNTTCCGRTERCEAPPCSTSDRSHQR